jgi:hypothetical protein
MLRSRAKASATFLCLSTLHGEWIPGDELMDRSVGSGDRNSSNSASKDAGPERATSFVIGLGWTSGVARHCRTLPM